jgi:hypothetical protein
MSKKSRDLLWGVAAVGAVGIIAQVDWLTGYELSFFVFYFLPVAVGAWCLGLGAAVALAVLSALAGFAADVLAGRVYASHFYAVWDTLVRLVAFLAIGGTSARLRHLLEGERAAADALRRSLSEIKVLEGFLPICAQCKKIQTQAGEWQSLEVYIGIHSNARFSHGYCPACVKQLYAEMGLQGESPEPPHPADADKPHG